MQTQSARTFHFPAPLAVVCCVCALAIGLCLAYGAEKPENAPVRPDERPRGRFQPSEAYLQRFSHAPPQVRKARVRRNAERPMTPAGALAQLQKMRLQRLEDMRKMENETAYRPAPAPASPTPRFQLPGASD